MEEEGDTLDFVEAGTMLVHNIYEHGKWEELYKKTGDNVGGFPGLTASLARAAIELEKQWKTFPEDEYEWIEFMDFSTDRLLRLILEVAPDLILDPLVYPEHFSQYAKESFEIHLRETRKDA